MKIVIVRDVHGAPAAASDPLKRRCGRKAGVAILRTGRL